YRVSHCAWYQIHCLIRLGHWRQAIKKCHVFIKKEPTEANWYLLASEIYIDQKEFRFAWEELYQASLCVPSTDDAYAEVCMRKRIVSEASDSVTRVDIIDKLPRDVLCYLFHFLDLQSLVRCLRVSKCWREFIMQSPPLWSRLDFSHVTSSLRADTLRMYLQRLGRSSLTYLSLNHHQVDGDGMLRVLVEHECNRIKSLSLNDVICTPEVFFNILHHVGSALTQFTWCGVSIRLNDLFNQIADNCVALTQLRLSDCFTSLHDMHIPHTASMSTITTLQSLELTGIHGMTIGHLASVVLRCPFLERLVIKRSLVNIIPVLNIIYSGYCQKLKYLLFERNKY
ncbi:hypothetical protein K501DRAFT_164806, partial [Backusella circina FSU 941]